MRHSTWRSGMIGILFAASLLAGAAPCATAQMPVPAGKPTPLPLYSKAAIVIDAASGRVLFEHNAHEPLPPASVTKVMTLVLALEAVRDGRVSLDDIVIASNRAASMGGTQIWLEPGERMPFGELLWAIAVGSANDAAVAVAEYLAGSESAFAQMMNARARELGARGTHFLNASGLPPADVGMVGEHVTTAYDIAMISRYALTLPHFLEMVSTWGPVVMRPQGSRVPELYTYNRMLRTYPGMDGIKTGFTNEAGYSIAATAQREGVRVIAVTFGAATAAAREDDVRRLLDYGFARLRAVKLYEDGAAVATLRVRRGNPEHVQVKVQGDVYATLLRDEAEEPVTRLEWLPEAVQAPIAAGQQVGTLVVRVGEYEVARAPLVAAEEVQRASFTQVILRTARRLLARDF